MPVQPDYSTSFDGEGCSNWSYPPTQAPPTAHWNPFQYPYGTLPTFPYPATYSNPAALASNSHHNQPEVQHNKHPFEALIRHGNISKCTSCGQQFQRDQQVLIIKHVEKSLYMKDGETKVSGERSHYYHADKYCLLHKHPYFTHQQLHIDTDIFDKLTPQNQQLCQNL